MARPLAPYRDLDLIEVNAGVGDLAEYNVDAAEPHAVVRGEDGLDSDGGPISPGDLVGLVADHGPEPRDEDRARTAPKSAASLNRRAITCANTTPAPTGAQTTIRAVRTFWGPRAANLPALRRE